MDSVPALSSMTGDPIKHHAAVAPYDHTSEEDVCSICLESFDSQDNPSTVTTCKHEFHLQCILEWSQRSKECPICWQVIVLKDPASQELLAVVEDERSKRSALKIRHTYEEPQVDHDDQYTSDPDFEEQIMRNFTAVANSIRNGSRRRKQRLSGVGPSQVHPSVHRADEPVGHEVYTSLEDFHNLGYTSSRANLISSSSTSASNDQTSPSVGSSTANVIPQNPDGRYGLNKTRILGSQSPDVNPGRPIAADMHAFSESFKSKFSAASAKYKESISKSTQGLKEKLLARNSPVKEIGRGVQREMSAGIAGVARMFERLDPSLKRTPQSSNVDGVNSSFSFKGKRTQDNAIAAPLNANSAEAAGDVSSNVGTMRL